ncbi:MAG: phenylacetate--CoA ligase family protein [Candidatus Heimdallarchaeota archaeon]
MVKHNYHWNPTKQKGKAEDRLFPYIRKIIGKYSPFYREWFKKHNINYKAIDTLEEFQAIPPVTKELHMKDPTAFILTPNEPEWWECNYQTDPIPAFQSFKYWLKSLGKTNLREVFGKEPVTDDERTIMEAVNEWLPIQFLSTKGSKEPALIAYTKRDITKNIPEITGHIFMSGFRTNWEVFNVMPASPSINFFQSVWSPLSVGGGTYFTCGEKETPMDKQLKLVSKITFEVFLGTPSYTKSWLKKAIAKLEKNEIPQIKSFKLCLLTGETLTDKLKQEIKQLFTNLGSTPAIIDSYTNNRVKASFYECAEGSGIHLDPRFFYWEVLHPKTLEPVSEGEKGYLCFSHIDWRGTAFIRYNTGDMVDGLVWEKCSHCGLTFPKIVGQIKRL